MPLPPNPSLLMRQRCSVSEIRTTLIPLWNWVDQECLLLLTDIPHTVCAYTYVCMYVCIAVSCSINMILALHCRLDFFVCVHGCVSVALLLVPSVGLSSGVLAGDPATDEREALPMVHHHP